MLDERKATILSAVVTAYIGTAQPVGSRRVAGDGDVGVSPATVRKEMAALEADGYLQQPHISAGRVPTDKGYRYFVDSLIGPPPLEGAKSEEVRSFFGRAHGELEEMLQDTSRLLASLTGSAGVVLAPHHAAVIRSVQLVELTPMVAVFVLVDSTGAVHKHTLEFDRDLDEPALTEACSALAAHFDGQPLSRTGSPEVASDSAAAHVVAAALRAVRGDSDHDDQVFVGGTSQMAGAFDAVDTVRSVLAILEQQYVVVSLLRDVLDRGLRVAIGPETGMEPLAECSVVVAPYQVEGEPSGSIAVLGPTRMDYPQALAAVAVVSQRLGRSLSEG